jgi:thiopeptide-type bacteriocin biosynthesis protein
VQRLRRRLRWPRWIALCERDNELPVDLDNVLSVETFAHMIRRRPLSTVVELLPAPDQLCASGPEGSFVHELIVPFVRREGTAMPRGEGRPRVAPASRRVFLPGSSWLYAKLYTGTATADRVLCEVVRPLVDRLLEERTVDRWFFLRYGDPAWHLRLRLHGDSDLLRAEALPRLEEAVAPAVEGGLVRALQIDTYRREVERYGGGPGIELAERLFHADSEAVLTLVELLEEAEDPRARADLAVVGADRLLVDLGLTLDERVELIRRVRRAFGREFGEDALLTRQLSDRHRQERSRLEALLRHDAPAAEELVMRGLEVLEGRSTRLAPIVEALRGVPSLRVEDLAASFVHMFENRLLRSAARAQELVIYDILGRYYASRHFLLALGSEVC